MEIKKATDQKVLFASLIDGLILIGIVLLISKVLKLSTQESNHFLFSPKFIAAIYFVLFLQVIPNYIFSQSIGKLLMKIKIVKKDSYERLSLGECIGHSLFLNLTTNQIIVEINNDE